MKTLVNTTTLIASLIILTTINLNASVYSFNEESYINDIPFNTTEIYNDIIAEQILAEFSFAEEEYIDDINFDTECITEECHYNAAVSVEFELDEEQYVDDIPFNTECVSANCQYLKAIAVDFNFEEESYIDDMILSIN